MVLGELAAEHCYPQGMHPTAAVLLEKSEILVRLGVMLSCRHAERHGAGLLEEPQGRTVLSNGVGWLSRQMLQKGGRSICNEY